MAKRKKFNELTSIEKYKRLRRQGTTCTTMKWISILSPYLTIGIINFDEYFVEANGVKMSMGCILAFIVAGVAISNETKENKKVNGLVGWAIAFALIYLFQSILNDLLLIVGCGFVGQLVGAGFEVGADIQSEKADLYKKSIIQAESYKER
jgi:chromate transport protein ChrA